MKSDNVKTVAGLAIIALIVLATFLYGNAQRQAQVKTVAAVTPKPSVTSTPVVPSGQITAGSRNATAPVSSPSANTIQGSQQGQTSSMATQAPTPVPMPTAAFKPANASATVASGATTIPDTGSSEVAVLAMAAMTVSLVYWRLSQRKLLATVRSR